MPGVDRANGALCQFLTHAALLYYLGGAGKERGRRDLLGLARIDRVMSMRKDAVADRIDASCTMPTTRAGSRLTATRWTPARSLCTVPAISAHAPCRTMFAAKQSKESCGRKSVAFVHRQCRAVASVACHLCDV